MIIVDKLFEFHWARQFEMLPAYLCEATGWTIAMSRMYKKGLKKHSNDPRVMEPLKQLLEFIQSQPQQPRITGYPVELNVHALSPGSGDNMLTAHLKGQKILVVFRADYVSKNLELVGLGTHQEFGWR